MKYPKYIENHLPEIKQIVESWPIEKSLTEVLMWIMQFDATDYDLAIRILRSLNVIGAKELNNALSVAYSKLIRHSRDLGEKISQDDTIFMPIGGAGKSGAMIAYGFRTINGLSTAHFLNQDSIELLQESKITNLVLIDDIIATGDQSSEMIKKIADAARSVGIMRVYVLAAFGFRDGIEKVKNTQVADVMSAVEYDEVDTVRSFDSDFYDGLSYADRSKYKERLAKYGKLGYGEMGALLSFYYNTPNCTIYPIWVNIDGWRPLLPRKHDTKADNVELLQIKDLVAQVKKAENHIAKKACSIYVEGKAMELFLKVYLQQNEEPELSGVNVVSIGTFATNTLIDELCQYSEKTIFITEEPATSETPHAACLKSMFGDKANLLLHLKDVFINFDYKKIVENEALSSYLENVMLDDLEENVRLKLLETRLFKHKEENVRYDIMTELVKNCLNEQKCQETIDQIINFKNMSNQN